MAVTITFSISNGVGIASSLLYEYNPSNTINEGFCCFVDDKWPIVSVLDISEYLIKNHKKYNRWHICGIF